MQTGGCSSWRAAVRDVYCARVVLDTSFVCIFGCEQELTMGAGIAPIGQHVHVGLC